jgi:hypothetical protein
MTGEKLSAEAWWETVRPMQLARAAKRLLAFETSAFLVGNSPTSERWLPYRRWLSSLTEEDTIITFNYDCVVELAKEVIGGTTSLWTPLPKDGKCQGKATTLLKLHGSTNWRKRDGDGDIERYELSVPLKIDSDVYIAVPGRSKQRDTGPLMALWAEAKKAIEGATELWIIGYGFPKSDNLAKTWILDAIRQSKQLRSVDIVLGTTGEPTLRVHDMISMALSGRRKVELKVRKLWAEDVLAVEPYERREPARGMVNIG